jgi:hypothetical protein
MRSNPNPDGLLAHLRILHIIGLSSGSCERFPACLFWGTMNKLLFADSAGPGWQKVYNTSHFALAALLPASLVSQPDGVIAMVADLGLAGAITVHNHIALNYGAPRAPGLSSPHRGR